MRILPAAAATVALTFAVATPASGHAELVPPQLPPGASGGLVLLISHGCGDEDEWLSTEPMEQEPTTGVTLQVPLELEIVPGEVEGWSLSTETDPTGRVVTARWDSDDPAGTYDTFRIPVDVSVADVPDGSIIWLPVVQDCADGGSLAWTLEGDVRGGDEVPAMRLAVNATASVPPLHGDDTAGTQPAATDEVAAASSSMTDGFGLPSLLLGLVGVGGIVTVLLRRRFAAR